MGNPFKNLTFEKVCYNRGHFLLSLIYHNISFGERTISK